MNFAFEHFECEHLPSMRSQVPRFGFNRAKSAFGSSVAFTACVILTVVARAFLSSKKMISLISVSSLGCVVACVGRHMYECVAPLHTTPSNAAFFLDSGGSTIRDKRDG